MATKQRTNQNSRMFSIVLSCSCTHTHTHTYIEKEMRWIQASDHRQTIDGGDKIETLGLSAFNRKSKLKFGINEIKFKTTGNDNNNGVLRGRRERDMEEGEHRR